MKKMLARVNHRFRLAVALTLTLLVLLFIFQNIEQTQVSFLFWTVSLSRALMLLVTLLLGVIIGIVSMAEKPVQETAPRNQEGMTEKNELNRTISDQEVELAKLHSELGNTQQILQTHEAYYKKMQDQITTNDDFQKNTEKKLATTKTKLSGAHRTISSLENEIIKLHTQIETKELVDRIIQHDLRGAISASISLPEAILDDPNLDDDQKLVVTLIRDSGKKMLETLDSSLTLYRIEEGTYEKKFSTLNLHTILSAVIERIHETLSRSQQDVSMNCMDTEDQLNETFLVYGDEFLLFSSFMNLILNASEASPMGKPISITLSRNDYCSVAIRNYGEVPKDIRETFFNKLVTSGKKYGTGLGTYSAQLMIKAQNGNIELDCSEPGMTTIYVSLPKPERYI